MANVHPSHQCACGSGLHESDCRCTIILEVVRQTWVYSTQAIAQKLGLTEEQVLEVLEASR